MCAQAAAGTELNSLGSIAPFGVNILRTFRVHSAFGRHSNTNGYSPVQALRSRASISRTATQITLYTMLEVRGHRDSPYIPVVALKQARAAALVIAWEWLVRKCNGSVYCGGRCTPI